uniref:Uncharacterized protein n=1 Tax=Arundo donax TaxID=35708 RepID=A0A0A9FXH2_ARUDO
MYHVHVVC